MQSVPERETCLDFATRTIFAPESSDNPGAEISATLNELAENFGAAAIASAISANPQFSGAIASTSPKSDESALQTLRAVALLIIESRTPRLTATLIGILAGLETRANPRGNLADLARDNGISKQTVSWHLARLAEKLGLERSLSTEANRESYRLMNRRSL